MQNAHVKKLYNHGDLLYAWSSRTIRARYQQSILGGLWAVLQPLATVVIFTVIFTLIIKINTGNIPYVVFSYTALVPWTFFANSISDMVDSLVGNMNLVSKIYFPREILPVAVMLARLLDFAISGGVLVILMIIYKMPFISFRLLYLPLILAIQLTLILGLGLAGAALNVFYRDVRHLFILGLQLWLYATPIIYPINLVPERFRTLYFLNPMAGIIEAYRAVLLYGKSPEPSLLLSALVSGVVLLFGYWFFKRVEFQFADVV